MAHKLTLLVAMALTISCGAHPQVADAEYSPRPPTSEAGVNSGAPAESDASQSSEGEPIEQPPPCDPQKLLDRVEPLYELDDDINEELAKLGDINGDGHEDYVVRLRASPSFWGAVVFASSPKNCFVEVYKGAGDVGVGKGTRNGWRSLEISIQTYAGSGQALAVVGAEYDGRAYQLGSVVACSAWGMSQGPEPTLQECEDAIR